jgi:hypothetical protein
MLPIEKEAETMKVITKFLFLINMILSVSLELNCSNLGPVIDCGKGSSTEVAGILVEPDGKTPAKHASVVMRPRDYLAFDNKGNLFVQGSFSVAGGKAADQIAQWNGAEWSPVGQKDGKGLNYMVNALATDSSGNLYAGGGFNTAGIKPANHIAKWEDTTWSALGGGLNGEVYALSVDHDGNLYAGGVFDTAGDRAAHNIARWDEKNWSCLGSGTEAYLTFGGRGGVTSLIIDKNILYSGGYFTFAGGKVSVNFALCTLNNTARTAYSPHEKVLSTLFTFEAGKTLVRVQLKSETFVDFRIYSLTGSRVYDASKMMPAGEHVYLITTAGLASGAYIARIKAGSESMRWKVVIGR